MEGFFNPQGITARHGTRLPHWQQRGVMQFVTFRLGDAMPEDRLSQWKEDVAIWKRNHPEPWSDETLIEYHRRFTHALESWLDSGFGSCWLSDAKFRRVLEETLMRDHDSRAVHHAWVIMPNHVHLLFTPLAPLNVLMKTWKGVSARGIGKGSIWQKGYRDTMIRDEMHFANAVLYIRRNPAKLRKGQFTLWESELARKVKGGW